MTAMLRPPVQLVRDLGWRQVLGLAQTETGFWAEVRGRQLGQLNRNVPFNLTVLILNMLAVLAVFGGTVGLWALAPWLLGMALLVAIWTLRVVRRRADDGIRLASQAEYWRVTAEIAGLALCWAGLMGALVPAQPADGQAMLMLFSMLFMGAVSNGAATMPAAVALVLLLIAGGMVAALPSGAPLDHPLVMMGLISFVRSSSVRHW